MASSLNDPYLLRESSRETASEDEVRDVTETLEVANCNKSTSSAYSTVCEYDDDGRKQPGSVSQESVCDRKDDQTGTGICLGQQSTTDCSAADVLCNEVGNLMLQPTTGGLQLRDEFRKYEMQQQQEPDVQKCDKPKARKRPLEFSMVSKAEHKRWRQEIDGFAQYSEWVAKGTQSFSDDMPELESTESVTSYDPAEEYYFKASIPLIDEEELAEINDFVDRVNKKIDEEEKEVEKVDANLKNQKKVWSRREEWDPFLAEKVAKQKKDLEKQQIIKNIQLFICFACGRAFDDEKHMRDHVNSVHLSNQGYLFKCSKCYRRFKKKHHLTRHEKTHDVMAVFKCTRCSSSFRKAESLKIHQSRVHSIDENGQLITALNFECNDCRRQFGTLLELNRHKYICLGKKRKLGAESRTSLCVDDASTSQLKSLDSPRPLLSKVCHVCKNKFASTQSLIRHIGRKHPNEQYVRQYEVVSVASTPNLPFVCSECQKRFVNTSALSLHKRRHAGNCPYECKTCGRRYPLASELRKHVRRTHQSRGATEVEGASLPDTESSEEKVVPMDQSSDSGVNREFCAADDLTDFVL